MTDNLTIDFKMFAKDLEAVGEVVFEEARNGLAMAGMALLNDAVMDIPTVPLKLGFLRGSGSVFVQDALVSTSPMGEGGGSPAGSLDEASNPEILQAVVVFNTPYAAYQHEGQRRDGSHVIKNWTTPGSGIKFLESKVLAHGKEYMTLIANSIKKARGTK